MSTTSALDTLIDLTREALEVAGRTLADQRRTQRQAQEQMNTLEHYRQEYRQRLQQTMQQGIAPASLHNYRAFLGSLDDAIQRAVQTLDAQRRQVDHSQRHWQEQRRKLNSYDTLVERRARLSRLREHRDEQRSSDEIGAQLRLRQGASSFLTDSSL
ncbi:flagellar export protein FliJ [Azorhizophilus paspali]|uniref:Flagellar FliJ protein n=1 Tax=Azorhizophilus paspali TaxID=69963 RepID=A0ABV6SJD3_AZOPA